jgi:hypothetical protein
MRLAPAATIKAIKRRAINKDCGAQKFDRPELARLVRRVHGGGAGRDGAADVSDYDVIVIGRQLVEV